MESHVDVLTWTQLIFFSEFFSHWTIFRQVRRALTMRYGETWITWTAGNHKKGLSYDKFELWVMLFLCISHVATVASPFHSSAFHFLLNFLNVVRFSSHMERKTMKLSLLHKNENTSSHRKGTLVALTTVYQFESWLRVWDMPSKLSLTRQGPWKLVWV